MFTYRQRGEPRFRPNHTVRALILDGENPLAHGTLVNISRSGARLMINLGVKEGRLVRLELRSSQEVLLDTRARTVWYAEGFESTSDLVGIRQGLQFAFPQAEHETIRDLLFRYGWDPAKKKIRFDALDDPEIENLFVEQALEQKIPFDDLRHSLQQYIEHLVLKL
jgi:hypothetical protein